MVNSSYLWWMAGSALIAAGSDSGAVGVWHGPGTRTEYSLLHLAGITPEKIDLACRELRQRFVRGREDTPATA